MGAGTSVSGRAANDMVKCFPPILLLVFSLGPSGRLSWSQLDLKFRGAVQSPSEMKAQYDAYIAEETGMSMLGYD